MKKYYLLLSILLLGVTANSQTNTFPSTGNSGIGTLSPTAGLEIYRSYNANETKALKMFYDGSWGYNTYATAFRFLDIASSEGGKILQLNGYGMGIGFDPPTYLSSTKLCVNGNVGIGTASPTGILSIAGANNTNRISISDGIVIANMWANGNVFNLSTETSSDIHFYPGANQGSLHLSSNGYVGIGTSTPTEKLSVNGKIRAKEIKVENANWPDYVFAKGYQLPSLKETEKQIKEQGHLPGIPSAAEVKSNGVDLGEMNVKLLEKIEELTLHLIRIERENESQKKDIEYLKSKIK